MTDKILIDTNLWVYLYSKNPTDKYLKIRQIVAENISTIVISTQILGELYHVLTRKNLVPVSEAREIILEMITNFPILEIDTMKVIQALEINTRYRYSYWDSLIIATALLSNCGLLYSEDMHHEQLIDGKTTIINPFV